MKVLLVLSTLLITVSCQESEITDFDFLAGKWKIEGKEQYEVWAKESNHELVGYSFKMNEGKETVLESIVIRIADNQVVYEATVPDQNENQTIKFVLNPETGTCYSFENIEHDFPTKIQYHKISDKKILIRVLGEEDKGFSYTMYKQ